MLNRSRLRDRIGYTIWAAEFEAITAELVSEGQVEVETVRRIHQSIRGHAPPYKVQVYRLTRRSASTSQAERLACAP